ncbi:MAG TPA: metallophosphoesterase family protein [Candidatus Dormibacteraeota bacterium]|jgi:alkaline phosphatase D|nr:metallophosphoesterase family protein [Candidatus Dormibacteraeota bacterium]
MNSNARGGGRDFSRRAFLRGGMGLGLAAAATSFGRTLPVFAAGAQAAGATSGTAPEQVHLTFGSDPARTMVASWASLQPQPRPQLRLGTPRHGLGTTIPAQPVTYADGLNGQRVYVYHAPLRGLNPASAYVYEVSDGARTESTFQGSFATAPAARTGFRFTSFGDLATPNTAWVDSSANSATAVRAVESFSPLFHLLNGDLCYANTNMSTQPAVWRDFANNAQYSAAYRPWMPCLGNHEVEFDNGAQGYDSYLTRFSLPGNGIPSLQGHFYSFQVGSVLFIALDANDVIYEDSGAFTATDYSPPDGATAIPGGTTLYVREYSGQLGAGPQNTLLPGRNLQTLWLERTLAAARSNPTIDWIVVQMHQDALSSSTENNSDLGIRQAWVPLFDRYQVDLVLAGHSHDFERSFPVRGTDHNEGKEIDGGAVVDTNRPHPVTTDASQQVFDTTQGTVYVILGGGGTDAPDNIYGVDAADGDNQALVVVARDRTVLDPTTGKWAKGGPQAVEDAPWSAKRDPGDAYGVGVFDVDPGQGPWDRTSITMRYYHAPVAVDGSTSYTLFDEITLKRPRSDGAHWSVRTPATVTGG